MSRYIDADKINLPKGFFNTVDNVPKFYEWVETIPTADVVEVKHGKWVEYEKGMIVTSYKCSLCGRVVRDDTGYDVVKDYPYCHCGAKMEAE